MKIGVVYSGGKDSTRAIYEAKQREDQVCCLITIIPPSRESYMFHYPNACWTQLQAEAMGIPIISRKTSGEKEYELSDLYLALKQAKETHNIEGIYTGGIASNYQKKRFEQTALSLGLDCFNPLWGKDEEKLLLDLIRFKFDVIFVGVSALGLNESWLGRKIDLQTIEELKKLHNRFKLNLAFEGGEAETLVLDCPMFRKKLQILEAERYWKGDAGLLLIKRACLVNKT
jgi:diphthine-ammonia ligase